MRRTKTSYNKGRLRDLLWMMLQRYHPVCRLCGKVFTEADLPTRGEDNLTEHHSNGIHEDNRLMNRELVHRTCHKRYHVKDNIHSRDGSFWSQFNE